MGENYLIPMRDSHTIDFEELMDQDPMLLKVLAARDDVPAAVLARLACHSSYSVKTAVARNEKTPKEVLEVLSEQLLTDKYGSVTNASCPREVAANPNTSPSVLKRVLLTDSHGHVNALKNENTPLVGILSYLVEHIGDSEKSALNFNLRFNDLIRIAAKLDAEHEASLGNPHAVDASDFDSDDETVEAQWG